MGRRFTLFTAGLMAASALATSAFAAQGAPPQAVPEEGSAGTAAPTAELQPASAPADTAAASTDGPLGEIVVMARRRAENLQDTPISLTVATGEDLINRNVTTFIDVQRQTPSLLIAPAALSSTATNLSMRGQSLVDIRLSIDPAVAIYLDGVYLPRAQGSNASDLIDIDRVEVLSGVQGTLFGKNTTGGAVVIYANTPTDKFEGFVRGRVGTYGEANLGGMLNLPLTEGAALRLVGNMSHRGGYGENPLTGDDLGELDSRYVRGTLLLEPLDRLTITLRGDYTKADVTREAFKGIFDLAPVNQTTGAGPVGTLEAALELFGFTSPAAFLAQPLGTRLAQLNAADAALRDSARGDLDDASLDQRSVEDVNVWGVSGQLDFEISDALSLKSITAYRGFLRRTTQDLDGTRFALLQYPFQRTRDRQFSQEAQLNLSAMDDRLNAVAGIYYSDEDGRERIDQLALRVLSGANAVGTFDAIVENRSFGVFGQATFDFTDQLSATGGLRYTKDKRFLNAMNYNATTCTSLGVPLASIGGVGNCERPERESFSKVNYTAGLEYRPNRDIMIYAKTNRGYRSGGLQQSVSANTPAQAEAIFQPYRPEIVTDYEVGIKSELFDRRVRANIALFHTKLQDAIRNTATIVPGETRPASSTRNAAGAKVDGVEFDLTAVPADGLELSLNGAYLDGRFTRYVTPVGEDRSFLPLLFTPEWRVGGVIAYTARTNLGEWRNSIDGSYTSTQMSAEPPLNAGFRDVVATVPKHTVFNARSSVQIDQWDLNVALFVRNLTNERYRVFPVDLRSPFGFAYTGMLNRPRTVGIELIKNF